MPPSPPSSPGSLAAPVPSFERLFGRPATVVAQAPGRVNLIGEHTDYTGGFVLPTAIPRHTRVELARRPDRLVSAASENGGDGQARSYALGQEERKHAWTDYLEGTTRILAQEGFSLSGFDARFSSSVPLGAGLSSSASFEVAVMRGLRELFALDLDDVRLARLGQKVENQFVGAPVGIMDQMAASLADVGTALFLDTRSLEFERIALPAGVDLIVLNSGVTHNHAGGEYRTRRAELEAATAALGVPSLREVGIERLPEVERLDEPARRRARHVVTENQRVRDFVHAMRAGDGPAMGTLLQQGHASLRDDFQVSVPEIDLIVGLAEQTAGVYGARLTGGGFGGSVVILVTAERASAAGAEIASAYQERSGRVPSVFTLRA